jgi:hypothetical protein
LGGVSGRGDKFGGKKITFECSKICCFDSKVADESSIKIFIQVRPALRKIQ